jgi:hypothetical protein
MIRKPLPILLAAAVATAPMLCCCILPGGQASASDGPVTALGTVNQTCCPTKGNGKPYPEPAKDSSCSCAGCTVLATESPATAAIAYDPAELHPLPLAALLWPVGLSEPVSTTKPLARPEPVHGYHGESLHALRCLFT